MAHPQLLFFFWPFLHPFIEDGFSTVAHICHSKTYFSILTAKLTFPRQNLLLHGKTYFQSMAKLAFSRQNLLFHGKTYFLTAKLTFPWQNVLSHSKSYFSMAKFCTAKLILLWQIWATKVFTFPHNVSKN